MFVTVIAPVEEVTLIAVPAVMLVTPVFVSVIEPVEFVTPIPVPGVSVDKVNPVPFPMRS